MMMEDREAPLAPLRRSGARLLAALFWLNLPVTLFAGLAIGSPDVWAATFVAGTLAVLPTVMVFARDRQDAATRLALGATAVCYPALFVFLFRGHAWQMDMHMYFFAALASLAVLCDKRAILAAAALTAMHHLLFNFVAPGWVFSGTAFSAWGDVPRVLLHAAIVVMQTAVLLWLTDRLDRSILAVALQAETSEAARARSDEALAAFQETQRAEDLRRAATEAEERRRFVADEIEVRFGAIVKELGEMAARLSDSKSALSTSLASTAARSQELRFSHERAKMDVEAMASDTEHLAASINEVGRNSSATRETVSTSARVTRELPAKVEQLDSAVDAADGILRIISSIAGQSSILALNATIEAARGAGGQQGFAVVASEIKSLSEQTTGAVDQIARHLEDIRGAAASVAGAITVASESAGAVDKSSEKIARVVQEQVTATTDLAAMSEQIAQHVALAATEAHAMAESISAAREAMDETGRIASGMADCSKTLHDSVHNVLAELRAA